MEVVCLIFGPMLAVLSDDIVCVCVCNYCIFWFYVHLGFNYDRMIAIHTSGVVSNLPFAIHTSSVVSNLPFAIHTSGVVSNLPFLYGS